MNLSVEKGRAYLLASTSSVRDRFVDPVGHILSRHRDQIIWGVIRGTTAFTVVVVASLVPNPDSRWVLNQALNNLRNPEKSARASGSSTLESIQISRADAQGIHRIYVPIVMKNYRKQSINWDIGSGVSDADVAIIREGIGLPQAELQSQYGGDVIRLVDNPLRVKIVADGTGDGCCSALDESGARIFLDVRHTLWRNAYMGDTGRKIIAAHEYTHTWHNALGCLTLHNHLLPDWLEEGTASYIPTQGLVHSGILNTQVERYFNYVSAKGSGQLDVPLKSLEHPAPIYPGHVGYLAAEYLIQRAPSGSLSLRTVCESVASGSSEKQAFQTAFGQSKDDLYRDFPTYLQSLRASPIYLEQGVRLSQKEATSDRVSYELYLAAFGFEDLTPEQRSAAWTLPKEMCGFGSELIGRWTITLCNAPAGKYPVSVQMPDGRKAQIDLAHSP